MTRQLLAGLLTADSVELAQTAIFYGAHANYYAFLCHIQGQVRHHQTCGFVSRVLCVSLCLSVRQTGREGGGGIVGFVALLLFLFMSSM